VKSASPSSIRPYIIGLSATHIYKNDDEEEEEERE
jgi:hypothetical protein